MSLNYKKIITITKNSNPISQVKTQQGKPITITKIQLTKKKLLNPPK